MKSRLRIFLPLCLSASLAVASPTFAAWLPDGTPVCLGYLSQGSPEIISDGAGGAIIVWQDVRNGEEDIYAQRIDANGIVQWDVDGAVVCVHTGVQESFQVTSDGAGGAIITWQEGSSDPVWAQRIDSSGRIRWEYRGIPCAFSTDPQRNPQIIPDGVGGAVLTWDQGDGLEVDIYAQRVNSSGEIQWDAEGVAICDFLGEQNHPKIVSDGAGGAIIAWRDWRDFPLLSKAVYAQRINSSGEPQWEEEVAIHDTADQIVSVSDAAGGAIIAWGSGFDIYAQRVDTDGAMPWGADAVYICASKVLQEYPEIVSDGAGGAIITWQDQRGGSYDIYAQRVNSSGVVQWQDDGKAICAHSGDQVYPQIVSDGAGGAIITWQDERSFDIYAQRINTGGTVEWSTNGVPICEASGGQGFPRITSDGSAGAIITWQDERTPWPDIYAQRINTSGNILLGAICTVEPAAIDFDTVTMGESRVATFTITNAGGVGTLSGSIRAACGDFTIVSGGGDYTLAQGQSKSVVVRYEPVAAGTHACLVTTGLDCFDVLCTGFGQEAFPGELLGTETVDELGDVGWFTSIALDGQANPHISYWDATATALKYAVKAGGTWAFETVDAPGVGFYTSLALDAQGNPHISYYDSDNHDLKYAVKTGWVWNTETADSAGDVGSHTSLALDAQGNPHISYYDADNHDLKYAVKTEGGWSVATVDAAGDVGTYTSLALDAQGNPHVTYYDGDPNQNLKYAVKRGGSWERDTADNSGVVGRYSSLALDVLGNPRVSYFDMGNDDIKYAVKTGGVWNTETVDATVAIGSHTSLALDARGNPHISYYDSVNEDLKYAVNRGGVWELETIAVGGEVGRFNSLALDYHGNLHVSFYDGTNNDLMYSTSAVQLTSPVGGEHWSVGGQETVRWEGAGEVDILLSQDGGATYVTLHSSVSGGIATVNVPGWTTDLARVKIVRNSPYSTSESPAVFSIGLDTVLPWWTATVDSVGDVGGWASLALGPQGNPHISYSDGLPNNDLKYAVKVGGSWVSETVDQSGTVGTATSLAFDALGVPHISYYAGVGALRYATKVGGVWVPVTIESGGVGLYNSLALDAHGTPHIGYYDGNTPGALMYVTKAGGAWLTPETVDAGGQAGVDVAVAVDAQGNPHISYYLADFGTLRYAVKVGASWSIEQLVGGPAGRYSSIALDNQGNPCISFLDGANGYLMYVVKSGGSWLLPPETVDTEQWVGFHTSLALDAKDTPHISYQNFFNNDLKYAVKVGGSWSTGIIDSVGGVGGYTSLALDAQGNPHISYYDATNGDLKYASVAIEVAEPSPGTTWPVGAPRAVTWDGVGVVDVWLCVDGGVQYDLLASGVSNGDYMLTVPHTPSRFCKVKLERTIAANTFGTYYYPHSISVSDSFFTIETSVSLLMFAVTQPENEPGLLVSWNTDPGPSDLDGYRLEKRSGSDQWFALVSRTGATSHHDVDGVSGDRYRLFAINGLGEEFYLGEASDGEIPSFGAKLTIWPVPFQSGELSISFPTGAPGGASAVAEVVVYDVAGRRVKTIVSRTYPIGVQRVTWDGRDDSGKQVASGVYFIRASSGGLDQTRKFVVVR